jgi:hypothetical protein
MASKLAPAPRQDKAKSRGLAFRGAFHPYWRFSALGEVTAIETIENWSLKICHLQLSPASSSAQLPIAFDNGLSGAASIMFESRLIIRTHSCTDSENTFGVSISGA